MGRTGVNRGPNVADGYRTRQQLLCAYGDPIGDVWNSVEFGRPQGPTGEDAIPGRGWWTWHEAGATGAVE